MKPLFILGAAALGIAAMGGKRKKISTKHSFQNIGPDATLLNPARAMAHIGLEEWEWPELTFDIPFGAGIQNPVWPLITNHSKEYVVSYRAVSGEYIGASGRRFMAHRSGDRFHVGVDLYCEPGDPVIACEDGTIVNLYHFYHGSYCMVVQCDSRLVINYAEVRNGSWEEFGIYEGSHISRGQPIARIGIMSGGSSMLHFETYMPPTPKNQKYFGGNAGPILNPTYYLLLAATIAMKGQRFAATECLSNLLSAKALSPKLEDIAAEERRLNEKPSDSVLSELNLDVIEPWREDEGDGP